MATVATGQEWRHRSGGEVVEILDAAAGDVTTWRVRRADTGEESSLVEGTLLSEYRLVGSAADDADGG